MKRLILIFAALMLLLTPVIASATVALPDPLATKNCWDEFGNFVSGSPLLSSDTLETNPPIAPNVANATFFEVPGFEGVISGGGRTTDGFQFATSSYGDRAKVGIKIFNFPNKNPFKELEFGIFYKGFREITNVEASSNPVAAIIDPVLSGQQIVDGNFFQSFTVRFEPNPLEEFLILTLDGSCFFNVDKVCITTQCVPTPIPGSLLLLGSGILGMVGIGIRRKSA